jgi:aspartyl/glutamyl-tRNA(Asn/Gln) amidotransferase C subunit
MKNKKIFTKDFTAKIASLSHLELAKEEESYFTIQFNTTLEAIKAFSTLKTTKKEKEFNLTGLVNVFRNDEIDETRVLSQEEALSNAKRIHNGYFVVPGLINSEDF